MNLIFTYRLLWFCHWCHDNGGLVDPNFSGELLKGKMLSQKGRRRLGGLDHHCGALVAMTLEAAWQEKCLSCWWAVGGRICSLGEPYTSLWKLLFLSLLIPRYPTWGYCAGDTHFWLEKCVRVHVHVLIFTAFHWLPFPNFPSGVPGFYQSVWNSLFHKWKCFLFWKHLISDLVTVTGTLLLWSLQRVWDAKKSQQPPQKSKDKPFDTWGYCAFIEAMMPAMLSLLSKRSTTMFSYSNSTSVQTAVLLLVLIPCFHILPQLLWELCFPSVLSSSFYLMFLFVSLPGGRTSCFSLGTYIIAGCHSSVGTMEKFCRWTTDWLRGGAWNHLPTAPFPWIIR